MQKPSFEQCILSNPTLSYNGLMVHHYGIFLVFLFLSALGHAQDERYYRQIMTGELPQLNRPFVENAGAQFNVRGGAYKIDLNGDQVEETIEPQKRDGVDWLEIRNFSQRIIFEGKLLAMGAESSIYKIKIVNITKKVKALIVFLDEGFTAGKKFESTGRFYVLSFENNDLGTIKMTEGPHFFHEKESQREQYWRRNYPVNVYDLDGDGSREIVTEYNHIQRVMKYMGEGEWKRY